MKIENSCLYIDILFPSSNLQNGFSSIESSIAVIHWSLSSWVAAAILQDKSREKRMRK